MTPNPDHILACYADRFRLLSCEFLGSGGGFSGAVIVRVHTDCGNFCLRGWPPHGLPRQRILGLHRLLRTVFEQGITQVSVPVAARDGQTIVRFDERDWQLEPWMLGKADFQDNPSAARLQAAMTCLAGWHRAAALFEPAALESRWFCSRSDAPSPAVSERLEIIHRWLNGRSERLTKEISAARPSEFQNVGEAMLGLFKQFADPISHELTAACNLRVSLQPCLRDVWHDHVLFTGDAVTGLIDASACRSENITTDLARLLGSLLGDDRKAWESALDEYQKYRPLTPAEWKLLQVLDRSSVLLSGMTWLDRRYLQNIDAVECPVVVERLKGILKRMKHLAATI